jgi:hypothetical protein
MTPKAVQIQGYLLPGKLEKALVAIVGEAAWRGCNQTPS